MAKQGQKKQGQRHNGGYVAVMEEVEKPMSERKALLQGRSGKVVPRRYHLVTSEVKEMKKIGGPINPYRQSGAYGGFVQALINLGVDKVHSLSDVKAEMRKIMKAFPTKAEGVSAWEAFEGRSPRKGKNSETAKDVNGKIVYNAEVLQRVNRGSDANPYGLKLAQFGECIDILQPNGDTKKPPMFRLRTNAGNVTSVKPINERRTRTRKAQGQKPVAKVAAPKAAKKTVKKARKQGQKKQGQREQGQQPQGETEPSAKPTNNHKTEEAPAETVNA